MFEKDAPHNFLDLKHLLVFGQYLNPFLRPRSLSLIDCNKIVEEDLRRIWGLGNRKTLSAAGKNFEDVFIRKIFDTFKFLFCTEVIKAELPLGIFTGGKKMPIASHRDDEICAARDIFDLAPQLIFKIHIDNLVLDELISSCLTVDTV